MRKRPDPRRDRDPQPIPERRRPPPAGDPPPDEEMRFPPDPDRQRPRRSPRPERGGSG
jgi:hypothetical protein